MPTPEPIAAEDSVAWLIGNEILERIKALGLEGIPHERYEYLEVPLLKGRPTPCVMVGKFAIRATGDGTNESDDWAYTYLVTIASASRRDPDSNAKHNRRNSLWGERVRKLVHKRRITLPRVGVHWRDTQVTDAVERIPEAWRDQYLAQYLLIEVTQREVRELQP